MAFKAQADNSQGSGSALITGTYMQSDFQLFQHCPTDECNKMFLRTFQVKSIQDWILKATAAHKESFGTAGTAIDIIFFKITSFPIRKLHSLYVRHDSSWLELTNFDTCNRILGFRPHILALSGASGAGKSTAVELLCKELSIPIKVWTEDSWDHGSTTSNINLKSSSSSSSSYSIR